MIRTSIIAVAFISIAVVAGAQQCADCPTWNQPHAPFQVFGNTYYVGTNGLGAVLITSPRGHVLIDGGLAQSAPLIRANIEALGFRIEDVKLILNSHAHYDHAGGIAELQRASGARVAASPASARELRLGIATKDDPQVAIALPFPRVARVDSIADGDTLRTGDVALTAHFTPGHTPGGTTWTWRSCEGSRCLDLVYADSQTPVSADGFYFTRNTEYPSAIDDFRHSEAVLEDLPCDILMTPHPSASGLWERLAARGKGDRSALIDPGACKRYAATAREQLANRIAVEKKSRP